MPAIEFRNLTKTYGQFTAVDSLTASIEPGRITGFLGPNGAGKSTAIKCLLGLARATSGEALVEGAKYAQLDHPTRIIGGVLDTSGFNPALTAQQNLKVIAAAAGIPDARTDEVLELVDLSDSKHKRTKGFSLGMKQRLTLAAALLGSPRVLVLDEPTNGLDPIGIAWLRRFLRTLADEGTAILVSSHQLAEMEHTVDDVLIINKGRLIAQGPIAQITSGRSLEVAFFALIEGGAA